MSWNTVNVNLLQNANIIGNGYKINSVCPITPPPRPPPISPLHKMSIKGKRFYTNILF